MRASSPGALMLSAVLHGAVVALVVALSLWFKRAAEVNPLVLDLVDLKDLELADKFEMPGPVSDNPKVRFNRPRGRRVPIPKPEPVRETPAPPASKTVPVPPPSRVKTTSYSEFQKKNQKQLQANQKVRTAKSAPAPGIDAKGIVEDLMKTAGTNGTRATAPALDAYFARLISALRAAHEMPDSVDTLLTARVSFFLAADGSISSVKIVAGSGSPDFDASVVEAFRRVRSVGAVPGGKSGTYVVPFRMAE